MAVIDVKNARTWNCIKTREQDMQSGHDNDTKLDPLTIIQARHKYPTIQSWHKYATIGTLQLSLKEPIPL